MRVGINGMGRIGRLALRSAMGAAERPTDDPRAGNRLEVVHLNEVKGGVAATAHLLEFDSVQGRWRAPISSEAGTIQVDQRRLGFTEHTRPADIPWGDLGVDVVLECTGKFLTSETLRGHLDRGAKRVVVAAPVKENDVLNVVIGVNEHLYCRDRHPIVTAASCTTNCLAPVAKVLHEHIGIVGGLMTTIHAYTNDQVLTDVYHSDLRRARSATMSMIPTKTGAAAAVGLVLPALKGKFDGFSVRVPTINVSLVDLTFTAARATTVAEIDALMKAAAASGPLAGVLAYTEAPLVSIDYNHDAHSSTYDATMTKVTGGTLVKVCAWYDNEWGFSNRMLDTTLAWSKAP